jgi:hypothetical protein
MGPAVTACGTVTPGYLPASYEQQISRYRLGTARNIYFWKNACGAGGLPPELSQEKSRGVPCLSHEATRTRELG